MLHTLMFTLSQSNLENLELDTFLKFYFSSEGSYSDVTCNKVITTETVEKIVQHIQEYEIVPKQSIVRIVRTVGNVFIFSYSETGPKTVKISFDLNKDLKRFHPECSWV